MRKRLMSFIFALIAIIFCGSASYAAEDYRAWTQDDERWGTIQMGTSGSTVKNSGCLVTSISKLIIQSELKDSNEYTPETLVTWMNNNGAFTEGGGVIWSKLNGCVTGFSYYNRVLEDSETGYTVTDYYDEFIEWINKGYHLVVKVKRSNGSQHWVAVDEKKTLETGIVYMMDSIPANVNADITLSERYSVMYRVEAFKGGKTPDVSWGDSGSTGDTEKPDEHVHEYERTVHKKATAEEVGKLKDTCKTCGHVKYVNISRIDTVKTQYKLYNYNGKVRKPKIIVTNKMGNTVNSKYYTVTYGEGRKDIGKYTITVEFKERYTGKYVVTFSIIPKKTNIVKLTSKEEAFKVKWEKVEEAGWYEIRYSTTSDFSENAATKRVSNKYTSSTVRDLKADTTYYVKMRTYKKVDGVRFYSGWTPVEEITTN